MKAWMERQRGGLLWRLISENAWQHRWSYAAALSLMAVVAGMGGAVALTVERITDEFFVAQRPEVMTYVALWVLAIFLVRGAAMYGQTVILARIGNRIVADLQKRLYAHVLAQGLVIHSGQDTGELATRMTYNATAARDALQMLATRLGVDLLTVIVLLGVMLWQDATLFLIALIGLPVIFGGIGLLVSRVRKLARAEVTLYSRILAGMSETVLGARVIRAFRLEAPMQARMAAAVDGVRDRADRIAVLQGLVNPLMETMAGIAAAGVILVGGWRVAQDGVEVGTFFSFLTALIMAGDPARRLGQLHVGLRKHLAGVAFIYEVLDRESAPPEPSDVAPLKPGPGEIRFEDVHFAYGGTEADGAALSGLSLTAAAGRVTALVGPSGAGKSTVLALIERFYDPARGRITVDGQDIRGVTLASLRDRIALVTQDTFLFDATAAENIGYGRPGATRDEIEAAARAANAHDFILALEQGYDTPLGEGGGKLSGGQRQRIAIARAMLRDAPILLLDEATSALDAETEARVQQALDRLMRGRTSIVIAHRLATVRRADEICVIEAGRLVERGTHDMLSKREGLYSRLSALQFSDTRHSE